MSSPIFDSVPPELLTEIFQHLPYSHEEGEEDSRLNAQNALDCQASIRAVSQVCTRWRDSALSSPNLWSEIVVTERSVDLSLSLDEAFAENESTDDDEEVVSRFFPWVATMLARSSPKPIHLYIHLHCESFNSLLSERGNEKARLFKAPHAAILSRLVSFYAARIQSLKLFSDLWMPMQRFGMGLVNVPMLLLEVWDVRRDDHQWGHQVSSDISRTAEMLTLSRPSTITAALYSEAIFPKLKEVTLTGGLYTWSRFAPCNLVGLHLGFLPLASRPTYTELKAVLLASQDTLESLTLCAAAPSEVGDPITLPKVHTLSVGLSFTDSAYALVHFLDVPNLKSLEISDMLWHNRRSLDFGGWRIAQIFAEVFYRHAITHWPVAQVTSLTLASVKFSLRPSDYEASTTICNRKTGFNTLPLPSAFLFQFTSLRNLTLIQPDMATFRALNWPVLFMSEDEANKYAMPTRAVFPCSKLERLVMQDLDLDELIVFFTMSSTWSDESPNYAKPREVDTIVLDVPSEWGASLRASLSTKVAREVVNKRGHFVCAPNLGLKQEFDLPPVTETRTVYNLLSV